jgi:PKD repeat protein
LTVNFTDLSPGTVTTWAWDVDNAGVVDYTTRNPIHTYTTPGTYTVRLYVTDTPGISDGTIVMAAAITVNAPPTADAGAGGTIGFGSSGMTIGGAPTAQGGAPPYTYSWSPATGLSSATVANPVANPGVTTAYTVTVTDASGCTATSSATVAVSTLKADAGSDDAICPGSGRYIGGAPSASGGVPPYTYLWTPAAGLGNPATPNPAATPGITTLYVLTVTDSVGAVARDTMLLTVTGYATANAGPDKTICEGSSVQLGGSPTGTGKGSVIYTWTPTTGLSDAINSNPIASPTVTTTYIVRVWSPLDCAALDTVTVFVNPAPRPKLVPSGPTSICQGQSVTLKAPSGYAAYVWSTGSKSSSITVNTSGLYYCGIVDNIGCVGSSDTIAVVVNPLPSARLTASGPTMFCDGDSVQITAPSGFTKYQWSTGDTTESIFSKKSGKYWVTVTNNNGCVNNSDTVTVTVNPLPVPVIVPVGKTTFCQGDTVVLKAPAGFSQYQWSTGESTPSITVRDSGDYFLVVTNSNGCKGLSNTISVRTIALPSPTLTANGPTSFCIGGNVQLSAPAGYTKYQWSTGALTPSINVKDPGNYWVMVTNSTGCVGSSDTVAVVVNPLPAPKLSRSGPTNVCQGDSLQISAPTGYVKYKWSTGDTTESIMVKTGGNYSVLVTNSNGCVGSSDTASVTILPLPKPKLVAKGSTSICPASTLQIDAPSGFSSYLWSNGATTQSITVSDSGRYSVIVTNSNGCIGNSDTITVKVLPPPSPKLSANGSTSLCAGTTVQLSAPAGFLKYLWSNGATTQTIGVKDAGNYWVTVTNNNGCQGNSDTISVTVNPLPNPKLSANGPTTFCQSDSLLLSAPSGFVRYQWTTGDTTESIMVKTGGNYSVLVTNSNGCQGRSDTIAVTTLALPKPKLSASSSTSICPAGSVQLNAPTGFKSYLWSTGESTQSITVSDSGKYWVMVSNANDCLGSSDTIAVKVLPPPSPKLSANGPTTFCLGGSVQLKAPAGYVRYLWSTGATTSSITVKDAGNYWVMVTNNTGCLGNSDTVSVVTLDLPNPKLITNGPTSLCQGETVVVQAPTGFAKYLWSTGDTTESITVAKSGAYSVLVTNVGGCQGRSDTVAVMVHAAPKPAVTASGETSICSGHTVDLSAPAGYTQYLWNTGETTQTITASQSGKYVVAVTDSNGCHGTSDTVSVTVFDPVQIPIISVNGPTTFCHGDSTELLAPSGYKAYKWSTGDTTLHLVVRESGNYALMVTGKDGCVVVSDSIAITVHSTPDPLVAVIGSTMLCQGDSTMLQAPAGFLRYNWSTGDTTRSIVVSRSGDYTVGVSDTNGCYGTSKPVTVKVNTPPVPTLTITGSTSFCDGGSVVLEAPKGFANYIWSDGNTDRLLLVTKSGRYSVTVTDSVGCHGTSDTVSVTVHPTPVTTISMKGQATFCEGDSVLLQASAGFSAYHWSTGETTREIVVKTSGSYSVDVTDSNGCIGTSAAPVKVDVHAIPRATIDGPAKICEDLQADYSVPSDSGHVYLWSVQGAMATVLKGQGTSKITVRWGDSGTAMVSVIVRDTTSGCAASQTLNVNVGHPFTPVISGGGSAICSGDTMTLDAGEGYAKYLWSTGDTTRVIPIFSKGIYSVTVWNEGGCERTVSTKVDRVLPAPKPSLSIIGTAHYPGDTLRLVVTPVGFRSYSWHKNGEWLTKDTVGYLIARENGIYTVEVTDSNGCHGSAEVYLDMWRTPKTTILLPNAEAAPGDTVSIPLQMIGTDLRPDEVRHFKATIRFDGTALMPVDTTPIGVLDPVTYERVITVEGLNRGGYTDSTVNIANLRYQVMLGDTNHITLHIESFEWSDTSIKVTNTVDGIVHISKICYEGVQPRFVHPGGQFAMKPVQPNPATGLTRIDFSLLEAGHVRLEIADMQGKVVATLVDGDSKQGEYSAVFDASKLASGTYFCRLQSLSGVISTQLIIQH